MILAKSSRSKLSFMDSSSICCSNCFSAGPPEVGTARRDNGGNGWGQNGQRGRPQGRDRARYKTLVRIVPSVSLPHFRFVPQTQRDGHLYSAVTYTPIFLSFFKEKRGGRKDHRRLTYVTSTASIYPWSVHATERCCERNLLVAHTSSEIRYQYLTLVGLGGVVVLRHGAEDHE